MFICIRYENKYVVWENAEFLFLKLYGMYSNHSKKGNKRVACLLTNVFISVNPLTPELNPFAQRCVPLLEILIFKGLISRLLYKSFGVKGLKDIRNNNNNNNLRQFISSTPSYLIAKLHGVTSQITTAKKVFHSVL
jgi:hypothetical protein